MTKKNILTILLDSIFVIAFNIVFFLNARNSLPVSVWVNYGFLHFAYLMVLITPRIEAKGKTAYLSHLSSYSVSFFYFLVELIFTVVIFYFKIDNTKLVVSAQTISTAIYLVTLISNLLANDSIEKKQVVRDIQIDFIKTISAKAQFIESITTDTALKSKVNNLYYLLHTSPTKTCSEAAVYETKIQNELENLEILVTSDKIAALEKIAEIEQIVHKRNFLLKARNKKIL